jgi:hypothetical protein
MMAGPLSPRVHGFIDYGSVVFLVLSPMLFGFSGVPATLCYLFAGALLVLSLITAYPLGVAKLVPFTIHGAIEAVSAVGLVLAPFLFGFSDVPAARNFFLVAGVALGIVFLVTNYKAAERPRRLIGTQRRITT